MSHGLLGSVFHAERIPVMSMSFRLLVSMVMWVAAACLPLAAQEPIVRQFGADGQSGAFRVRFRPHGAGIETLHLLDHYATLEAARAAKQGGGGGGHLLLAFGGYDHALRLVGAPAATRFPEELGTALWTASDVPDGIAFALASGQGLELHKTLVHEPAQRGFRLEIELRNTGAEPGGRIECQLIGPVLVSKAEASLIGNSSVAIAATHDGVEKHVGVAAGKIQTLEVDLAKLSFAGSTNRFFGAFLYPRDAATAQALTGLWVDTVQPPLDPGLGETNPVARVRYGLALAVPARGESTRLTFGLYLGPKAYREFEKLADPERFAPMLDVDLNPPCCIDVPGGRFMAKLLLRLLGWFHAVVGNWGFAIVMLTILVRGLLAPLNYRMQKSMRAYSARMAVLKPKLDALKTRYADDPKAYQAAMVAFQRENKLIPPLGGCLPIFLTMPVYLGLFSALRTAYELRQQPFLFWIHDLSRSDAMFELPFWPHDFNLLPLVWIGLYLFMMLRQPLPTDPQARQMQQIMRYMPILIGVSLYGYASALMVYMVTSMLWTLLESAVIKKLLGPVDPNVAAMTPTPM